MTAEPDIKIEEIPPEEIPHILQQTGAIPTILATPPDKCIILSAASERDTIVIGVRAVEPDKDLTGAHHRDVGAYRITGPAEQRKKAIETLTRSIHEKLRR